MRAECGRQQTLREMDSIEHFRADAQRTPVVETTRG